MNRLKVVLNVSRLPVPELLNKARLIVQNVEANTAVFASPNPATGLITIACNELEALAQEASDGSKIKIAIRNDKQEKLIDLLNQLAGYVEQTAAGNEDVVHLAAMDIKKKGVRNLPDFLLEQGKNPGSVNLRVKARSKTVFKWQYSSDAVNWINGGLTDVCKTTINDLAKGVYWFRVIFIDGEGEHNQTPVSFAVN